MDLVPYRQLSKTLVPCTLKIISSEYLFGQLFLQSNGNVHTQGLVKKGEKAALKEVQGFKKEITEKAAEGSYSAERWSEG